MSGPVYVHKAQPIGSQTIPDLTINAKLTLPEAQSLGQQDAYCMAEAQKIADALHDSLPGATFDCLLVILLSKKVSHFRVSYAIPEDK